MRKQFAKNRRLLTYKTGWGKNIKKFLKIALHALNSSKKIKI